MEQGHVETYNAGMALKLPKPIADYLAAVEKDKKKGSRGFFSEPFRGAWRADTISPPLAFLPLIGI